MLPDEVFGRAYGLAIPAAIAGIALGALAAPLLAGAVGGTGALVACGAVAIAYAGALLAAPIVRRPKVVPEAPLVTASAIDLAERSVPTA
jgi:hypothetical protein